MTFRFAGAPRPARLVTPILSAALPTTAGRTRPGPTTGQARIRPGPRPPRRTRLVPARRARTTAPLTDSPAYDGAAYDTGPHDRGRYDDAGFGSPVFESGQYRSTSRSDAYPEHVSRGDGPLRADQGSRPDQALRPDRAPGGWPAQPGSAGRPGGPAGPSGPGGPARPGGQGGPAGPARPGGPDDRSRSDRAGRPGRDPRPDREAWSGDPFTEADEGELPPWAGLSIYPTRPGGGRIRPPGAETAAELPDVPVLDGDAPAAPRRRRGRAAAARLRKSQRRVYVYCGTAIAIVVVIAAVVAIRGLVHKPAPHSAFVTTLQPGEFRSVPNACRAVSPALLTQYLPGTARQVVPAGATGATSQCTFTVDKAPVFRVLGVSLQAYTPSALAAGNGSGTANALDSFQLLQTQLAHPGKKAPLPAAQITPLTGLGQQAFSALQVLHSHRAVTDLVTVVARVPQRAH